jgi:hypothetical protein
LAESSHFLKSAGCTIAKSASADKFFYRSSEPAGKIVCVPIKKEDIDAKASRISGEVASLHGSLWCVRSENIQVKDLMDLLGRVKAS